MKMKIKQKQKHNQLTGYVFYLYKNNWILQ
jgi:hypothetical protein